MLAPPAIARAAHPTQSAPAQLASPPPLTSWQRELKDTCTFSPVINQRSRRLEEAGAVLDRASLLLHRGRQAERKQELKRALARQAELHECTFHPNLAATAASAASAAADTATSPPSAARASIFAHLHADAQLRQRRLREDVAAGRVISTADRELQECTFHPATLPLQAQPRVDVPRRRPAPARAGRAAAGGVSLSPQRSLVSAEGGACAPAPAPEGAGGEAAAPHQRATSLSPARERGSAPRSARAAARPLPTPRSVPRGYMESIERHRAARRVAEAEAAEAARRLVRAQALEKLAVGNVRSADGMVRAVPFRLRTSERGAVRQRKSPAVQAAAQGGAERERRHVQARGRAGTRSPGAAAAPLLFVDLALSPHTADRVAVYEGDSPHDVACACAARHGLSSAMRDRLARVISSNMQSARVQRHVAMRERCVPAPATRPSLLLISALRSSSPVRQRASRLMHEMAQASPTPLGAGASGPPAPPVSAASSLLCDEAVTGTVAERDEGAEWEW